MKGKWLERLNSRVFGEYCKFFAGHVSQAAQVADSPERNRMKRRAKARYSWDRKHGKCGGTGWVTVMASSRIGGKPMVAVEKCDCWRLISKVATVKKAKLYRDGKMEGAGG